MKHQSLMSPGVQIPMRFARMDNLVETVRLDALLETTVAAEKVARVTAPREMVEMAVVAEVTDRDARAWAQAMVSVTEPAPATAPAFSLLPRQLKAEKGRD